MAFKRLVLFPLALALAPICQALPSPNNQDSHVNLAFSLTPEDPKLLEKTLYELSDPLSKRHGKYLSQKRASALMRPTYVASVAVQKWLLEAGIPREHVQDTGPVIHAFVPEEKAKALLGGWSKDTRSTNARDLDAAIPEQLRSHIRTVHFQPREALEPRRIYPWRFVNSEIGKSSADNTKPEGIDELKSEYPHLFVPRGEAEAEAQASAATERHMEIDLEQCKKETTPACLKKIYHMEDVHIKPSKKILGIAGFNYQNAQYAQLESFLNKYAKYAIGTNFSVELINGGKNQQGEYASGEANLDVQYAIAMAHNLDVRFYAVGGENHNFIPDLDIADPKEAYIEPWLELATYLTSLPDSSLPSVLSLSYGVNEQVVPRAYAQQVCDLFGQLGTRGVSILAASGDAGPGQSCQSNNGSEAVRFLPAFPASCPWVTTVGATEGNSPEVAAALSGGGFSDYFARPAYQYDAVEAYLEKHGKEWEGYYNRSGRAFPDVAALGKNYPIFNHDVIESADGTSASTPVVAAMIATLNVLREKRNRPNLGFLNPWIYRVGSWAFTDITEGKSAGCPGHSYWGLPSPKVPGAGFPADEGWDAATGWGTPLFDRLRKLACF